MSARAFGGVLALLFAALMAVPGRAEQPIRVLTYNTHGLPAWIAGSEPERWFPRIGELTNAFSLALLQEDFAHHALLRQGTRQPVVERGNASQHSLCPICSGAGLTTLAGPPVALDALWNVPYESCSGWLLAGADCLASKGFQLARVQLPGGATFYVVNTHLDAGRGDADRAVRARQLARLERTVSQYAAGAALIVAGDFNLLHDHPPDRALLDGFASALGLVDSGARAAPGTRWPVLDYILFRSGTGALLEVTGAGEDLRFELDGTPLSDHPALFADFTVRAPAEAR